MKEDILEQLVDDYLQTLGYFTRHNLKFRPVTDHPEYQSRQDRVHSDIDVLAIHPSKVGTEKVIAVTCKAWQSGFRVSRILKAIEEEGTIAGRPAWKPFRELLKPQWTDGYLKAIEAATGSREFTYVTAVTSVVGDRTAWELNARFAKALAGNPVRFLTLQEMLNQVYDETTTTIASSATGRTLQLMKACRWAPNLKRGTADRQDDRSQPGGSERS